MSPRDGALPLREAELEPDDALRLPELPEDADWPLPLLLDPLAFRVLSPFVDELRALPPLPERSCELPSPELVLPEAPSPLLRVLLSLEPLLPVLPDAPYPLLPVEPLLEPELSLDPLRELDEPASSPSLFVDELPMPSSP